MFSSLDDALSAPGGEFKRPFGLKAIMALLLLRLVGRGLLLGMSIALIFVDEFEYSWRQMALFALDGGQWVLMLVVLVGLWQLSRWAWYLLMVFFAVSMTVDLGFYFIDEPSYPSMLVNVVMVFYVNQREVRQLFAALPATKSHAETS